MTCHWQRSQHILSYQFLVADTILMVIFFANFRTASLCYQIVGARPHRFHMGDHGLRFKSINRTDTEDSSSAQRLLFPKVGECLQKITQENGEYELLQHLCLWRFVISSSVIYLRSVLWLRIAACVLLLLNCAVTTNYFMCVHIRKKTLFPVCTNCPVRF